MTGPTSLVDLLTTHADGSGRYISVSAHRPPQTLTFADLATRSATCAAALVGRQQRSGPAGEHPLAVITTADPLHFVVALFAAARAGLVPVPGPSVGKSDPVRHKRLRAIVESAPASVVITSSLDIAQVTDALRDTRTPVVAVEELMSSGVDGCAALPATGRTAYVQFTSGSVTEPKPVVVGQAQLMANLRQAAPTNNEDRRNIAVNWIPLFHTTGLLASVIRPLWSGFTSIILDPAEFLRNPEVWPEAMSEWRATHIQAPEFGYALCAAKVRRTERFDLRALQVARVGGDLIRADTLRRFADAFEPAGFSFARFRPAYGMTEAVLTVTVCQRSSGPRILAVSRSGIGRGVVEPPRDSDDTTQLVSCGAPVNGTTVRIIGPSDEPLQEDGRVGEVWIAGPQVVPADPADQDNPTPGRRTGDLAFMWNGELVPVGRSVDRFQVRGENHYNSDVEAVVAAADSRLRPGRIAAFLTTDTDEPSLVVMAEVWGAMTELGATDIAEVSQRVIRSVSVSLGLSVRRVALVSEDDLPVTMSGKLRREECRATFEESALPATACHGGTDG